MKYKLSGIVLFLSLFVVRVSYVQGENLYPWQISRDSLFLFEGTTFRYTVDTPENEGLVSTLPSVASLKDLLKHSGRGVFRLFTLQGNEKIEGFPSSGDYLQDEAKKRLFIKVSKGALPPIIILNRDICTVKTEGNLTLDFYAGQRSTKTTVMFRIPDGIDVTLDNTTVNIIGRGDVLLRELFKQSIGRTGTDYSYKKVGDIEIYKEVKGTRLVFKDLDFRPSNGVDIRLSFRGIAVSMIGDYMFEASYITSEPEVLHSPVATTTLKGVTNVTDFTRNALRTFTYKKDIDLSSVSFSWTPPHNAESVILLCSEDKGKNWNPIEENVLPNDNFIAIDKLQPDKLYMFKLLVKGGDNWGESNSVWYYSGLRDIKVEGAIGNGIADDTDIINHAIREMSELGGGILRFTSGIYNVRTIHLQSNVWLHLDADAVIQALPGGDAPETTWFSDRAYRFGLSSTDARPYADPENYLTKQDVGHTFFRNAMFRGEGIDNVKIVGTGRITGNGNLVTSDKVMNNPIDKRCDKMFSLKLCTNVEIGGWDIGKDMWYDSEVDEPYYIDEDAQKSYNIDNMLHIDQGGHFVLLATGTDGIYVHDTYLAKYDTRNARDIYDFMSCNDVTVINVYSRQSSDDIVKLGSDCSLGFTRPARNYAIRNIVGDTNCNLFQIGSETADDIQDVYVDNIYVLGANKAGFSISTNDGGCVKNVYLNRGKTGTVHSRSIMRRTRTPFFISISNRGRVLGANVASFTFTENGKERKELLVTNVDIGQVENIVICGVDINEVYAGSSFRSERWKMYNGSQPESTPIIAGYKLPDTEVVKNGLSFHLPNGKHLGYVRDIQFHDVSLLVKGGHPSGDAEISPPEIGVGRYNVSDLQTLPSFGFWVRHVKNLILNNCYIDAENKDGRYAILLDNVIGAKIEKVMVKEGITDKEKIKILRSREIIVE